MVTDEQVRRLFMLRSKGNPKYKAALKSGMSEKTARKYLKSGKLPSQLKKDHTWRTRGDPFTEIWDEAVILLERNPGLEAKSLFKYFQDEYPDKFSDGQVRTFQRRVKVWKATCGPPKEAFFPQIHEPGELSASDFTYMDSLGITINHERFDHLVFHFVLTYSNWETGDICFSESFESLSSGLQNAWWKLGGVVKRHRTDSLSAAVHKECNPEVFTVRYQGLLDHYGVTGEKINRGQSNENGDVEQSNNRLKKLVAQSLMIRGSRDFSSRKDYESFLRKMFSQLNSGRRKRFQEERKLLSPLPKLRLNDFKRLTVRVGQGSTISVQGNVYSVNSRLIKEKVEVRLSSEDIEVWYSQKKIDSFPRLRGKKCHHIQYRHIIDWLVRKPGAFENYRYRDDLFPTTMFRMAYDYLKERSSSKASKEYLKILYLAAKETEVGVDNILKALFNESKEISFESVKELLEEGTQVNLTENVTVNQPDLSQYDQLLNNGDKIWGTKTT